MPRRMPFPHPASDHCALLGLTIDQLELRRSRDEAASLLAATPLKIGEPLTRESLHDAMQALFATGRFAIFRPKRIARKRPASGCAF